MQSKFSNVMCCPVGVFSSQAYLNYSMHVILDRALPHIADGLKPVQRRVIYAMSEIDLLPSSKYKKSARTVGDVLGKYHPHSDISCYEAMVLMTQNFSYRYPLIDGQGNWGSLDDPKSFAAMRYTESRLSKYSEIFLNELKSGVVNWQLNFDGTLQEPQLLPAQVPNILLNGCTGIAVGMSTDIPPHNLSEIVAGCLYLLSNDCHNLNDLMSYIPGPDYPGSAEILTSWGERKKIYETGTGSIRLRAVFNVENNHIIITHLPHQVSTAKIIQQIATQLQNKKIPFLQNIRDESDHNNSVRIVLIFESIPSDINLFMCHLFATTDLEKSYRINLNMISLSGKPQVKSLISILNEWLNFRTQITVKRLKFQLKKHTERLHILYGFLIILSNMEKVITIIRCEKCPKRVLQTCFKLTNVQVKEILNMRLRYLVKVEEKKIIKEKNRLEKENSRIRNYLDAPDKLKNLIKNELKFFQKKYGDKRKSPFTRRPPAKALKTVDFQAEENITFLLSEKGWLYVFKGCKVDFKNINYRIGDNYFISSEGKNSQKCLFFSNLGRVYTLLGSDLTLYKRQGEPITKYLKIKQDEKIISLCFVNINDKLVMASNIGHAFVTTGSNLISKSYAGKQALILSDHAKMLPPENISSNTNLIVIISNMGNILAIKKEELPNLIKGKGKLLIKMSVNTEEQIKFIVALSQKNTLRMYSGKRCLNLSFSDLQKNYTDKISASGCLLPRGFRKVNNILVK